LRNSDRRSRRKQLTRKLLKDAFIDLILENNDAESVTISEITNRADFNRGTFYIHYQDKIDILEDLYQDAIEGVYKSMMTPYRGIDKVNLDKTIPSIKLLFEHINKHKKLFKALDRIENYPDLYHRLEKCLLNIFTEKIRLERDTVTLEEEYEILINFEMHGTIGVIKYWIRTDFAHSVDFMIEQVISLKKHKVIGMKFKKQNTN